MPRESFYILDGNALICRAYFSPGADLHSRSGEPTKATYGFMQSLFKTVHEKKPDYLAMATDPPRANTWRRRIFPEYKAHRVQQHDDLYVQITRCKEVVRALGIPVLECPMDEADDTIATLVASCPDSIQPVIVGRDKDLMQLLTDRVTMFDPMANEVLTPAFVEKKFGVPPKRLRDYLAIVGDSTDGIPGVAGIGPKTAVKWIKEYGSVKQMLEQFKFLPPKVQLALTMSNVKLCLRLTTLKKNCRIPQLPDSFEFQGFNLKRARPMFRELGFKRWAREAPGA
jgi:DNA polymerase I